MNHNQKVYATKRIDGLESIKLREAFVKYHVAAVTLKSNDRINLIYKGHPKLKLIPRHQVESYTDLCNAYDFSSFETKESFKAGYDGIVKNIKKLAQDAKDEIMLGDCEEALRIIKKLEDITV